MIAVRRSAAANSEEADRKTAAMTVFVFISSAPAPSGFMGVPRARSRSLHLQRPAELGGRGLEALIDAVRSRFGESFVVDLRHRCCDVLAAQIAGDRHGEMN